MSTPARHIVLVQSVRGTVSWGLDMAKAICICPRRATPDPAIRAKIDTLNRRMTPDNITPNPPVVHEADGVTTAVLNPTDAVGRQGASVCLGVLVRPGPEWWRPRTGTPDGTYVLFRSDPSSVELLNDVVGSRTVWYIHTDDVFIASTSQRAIVSLLGSFEPDERVIPWMLSSGSLGPGRSYDRRIRVMTPNSRVLLDRTAWRVTVDEMGNDIVPVDKPLGDHSAGLQRVIESVFADLALDPSRWVLTLSGGVDSRAIVHWLKNREGLRSVTWGVRSALGDKGTDAYVAAEVARHFGLDHRFFETDFSPAPAETLFTRYLAAGEGRVDALAGYTDGFKIWKDLFEAGAAGVIRGDECFGMRMPVYTVFGARRYVNCFLLSDYANLPESVVAALPSQRLPDPLARRPGEPILRWRDRLYYNYRMPCVMAALTELKCSYVEVVNPFLTRSIVDYMRTVPDALRLGRKPFMEIARRFTLGIPYAERAAIDTSLDIFRSKSIVDTITDELGSSRAASTFEAGVLDFIRKNMRTRDSDGPARPESHPKYLIPSRLRKSVAQATRRPRGLLRERFKKPVLDPNVMAFRAFIVSRMHGMLAEDARAFEREVGRNG